MWGGAGPSRPPAGPGPGSAAARRAPPALPRPGRPPPAPPRPPGPAGPSRTAASRSGRPRLPALTSMATSSRRGTGGAALGSAGPGSAPVGAARLRSVVVFPAPCSRRSPTCSRREAGWQREREATALSPVRAAGARPRRGALPFTTKALSGSRAERVRHRRPPRPASAPPRPGGRPAPPPAAPLTQWHTFRAGGTAHVRRERAAARGTAAAAAGAARSGLPPPLAARCGGAAPPGSPPLPQPERRSPTAAAGQGEGRRCVSAAPALSTGRKCHRCDCRSWRALSYPDTGIWQLLIPTVSAPCPFNRVFSHCREKGISGRDPSRQRTHTAAAIVCPSAAIGRGHHTVDPNLCLSCFLPGGDFVTPRAIPASNTLYHAAMSLGTDPLLQEDLKQRCPHRGPHTPAPRENPRRKCTTTKKRSETWGRLSIKLIQSPKWSSGPPWPRGSEADVWLHGLYWPPDWERGSGVKWG